MDRRDAVLVAVCLLGLALVATAPSEPTYSMSLSQSPDAPSAEMTAFADLDSDAQREFLALLDDEEWRSSEPPALENGIVRYKGSLYRVHVSVSESSVYSLLQPVLGGGLTLLGALGLVSRRVVRRYRH
jgi:hypothetical protein